MQFSQHPQRSYALARRDVHNPLLQRLLFHLAGLVKVRNVYATVHAKSPFSVGSAGSLAIRGLVVVPSSGPPPLPGSVAPSRARGS